MSDALVRLMLGVICAALAHQYWLQGRTFSTICWSISAALWTLAGIRMARTNRDRVGR